MRQIILITHFMEEILLQTIIDKLETTEKRIEILTHTIEGIINHSSDFKEMNEKFRTVQMEVRGIPSRISVPGEEIRLGIPRTSICTVRNFSFISLKSLE